MNMKNNTILNSIKRLLDIQLERVGTVVVQREELLDFARFVYLKAKKEENEKK